MAYCSKIVLRDACDSREKLPDALLSRFPMESRTESILASSRLYLNLDDDPIRGRDFSLPSAGKEGALGDARIRGESEAIQIFAGQQKKLNFGRTGVWMLGDYFPLYWKKKLKALGFDLIGLTLPISKGLEDKVNWRARAALIEPLRDLCVDFPGFVTSFALTFPKELLENFAFRLGFATMLPEFIKIRHTFATYLPSLQSRLIAATYSEVESTLWMHQHGGGYGHQYHLRTKSETRISSVFWGWEWEDIEHNCLWSIPSRCLAVKRSYQKMLESYPGADKAPKNILIVLGSHSRSLGARFLEDSDYYNRVGILGTLKDLGVSKDSAIRIRCHARWDDTIPQDILEELCEFNVQIDKNERIESSYIQARLVIVNYPFSTTAWECKYLGIPCFELITPTEKLLKAPKASFLDY